MSEAALNTRAVSLTVVAFLLGAFAAGGIGVRVIREVSTADDATSLPTSAASTTAATSRLYQVDPNETLISSTALVPSSVEVTADGLAIAYDLVPLAPRQSVASSDSDVVILEEDVPAIYPRRWVIDTPRGSIEGGPANVNARVARFDVVDGFSMDEVESIRIVEALSPYSMEVPVTLSDTDPIAEVVPGVTIELLNVSDQGSSTIVQVAIEIEDPEVADFFVSGDGPGWRSAVFEAEGRRRVTLSWAGGSLPAEIPLLATGSVWISVEGPFVVSLEAVR